MLSLFESYTRSVCKHPYALRKIWNFTPKSTHVCNRAHGRQKISLWSLSNSSYHFLSYSQTLYFHYGIFSPQALILFYSLSLFLSIHVYSHSTLIYLPFFPSLHFSLPYYLYLFISKSLFSSSSSQFLRFTFSFTLPHICAKKHTQAYRHMGREPEKLLTRPTSRINDQTLNYWFLEVGRTNNFSRIHSIYKETYR